MIKIALAGNPNCGKTTLFNALTGSNQFVGNWPGVTVEKKEGKLKGHKDVIITDLPGIYSLSPYTLEEVVARNYLINEKPDVILNIVDGTNIERNLYLSTQLMELGIPVVMAVNMMDIVKKNGDEININKLSSSLGCAVIEISALKGTGILKAVEKAVELAERKIKTPAVHEFSSKTEEIIKSVENKIEGGVEEEKKRFFAIKLLESDEKINLILKNPPDVTEEIEKLEAIFEDDAESTITNERYEYISSIINKCYIKNRKSKLTVSDKIDRIVTNRFLALPIFAVVMFFVYYVSVTTVGSFATDWANKGVFGDGWHLFGIGSSVYEDASDTYKKSQQEIDSFLKAAEKNGADVKAVKNTLKEENPSKSKLNKEVDDLLKEGTVSELEVQANIENDDGEVTDKVKVNAGEFRKAISVKEPDPADYGVWVPGVPKLASDALDSIGCAAWLKGLVVDGIIGGVGSVLGFIPQMFVLFIFLAFLEACGYMARIAFIMDRIFRKFGLSGKSFIPMLIGSGCGVPGIMASRTIENDRDRKMTIITTTFIPCGAKLPIIALIAGALFNSAWWVAPSAYFVGICAIIMSGIILKKTKIFRGEPAPFVMELPAYHLPTVGNVLRSMWERGSSFIKKAGTIILLSTIFVWFTSNFGIKGGKFVMVDNLSEGFLSSIGKFISPIFMPLGWGNWKAAVAAITGLIAKENVVGTFGILYGFGQVAENGSQIWGTLAGSMTAAAAYSFLVFNLLCAPCFAAMGAIKREMNNKKWFFIAIGYQTGLAYLVSFCIYQISMLINTGNFNVGSAAAFVVILIFLYFLFRRDKVNSKNNKAAETV